MKEHIQQAFLFWRKKGTFAARRTFQIVLTQYATVSRANDLIDLQIHHVMLRETFVRLTLPHTKTDPFQDGEQKYMALARNPDLCPVQNFWDWLGQVELGKEGHGCPLPSRIYHDSAHCTHYLQGNLAAAMKGANLLDITLHCLRVGGALAMIEGGASIDKVQLAGTWADPRSTQVYVKWNILNQVEAAKKVQL